MDTKSCVNYSKYILTPHINVRMKIEEIITRNSMLISIVTTRDYI